MKTKKDLSIIVPVYNEQDSLNQLYAEIKDNVQDKYSWELIFINDGSSDKSKEIILDLVNSDSNVKLIDFLINKGKSEALNTGFKKCSGNVVLTLDADLQDDPNEIGAFVSKVKETNGLVSGWKKNRLDSLSKRIQSKIFNFVLRFLTKIKLHDFNCGFKAYPLDAVKMINIYGGLHRFIPVLVKNNGFAVSELVVNHRKRKHGYSKYTKSRIFHGFFDLITLMFFKRYLTRPLHLFGLLGLVLFMLGIIINVYLTINWFNGIWITPFKNPLFFLGLLLLIIGVQFFSIGLVCELIVNINKNKNRTNARYFNFDE
ncbi:MAG: glycosyltransferase [Candidatus Marinimicrobia bacterium]|nr:glycosyltransferase [Candidatus Neomarinimicrobiota bacterium]